MDVAPEPFCVDFLNRSLTIVAQSAKGATALIEILWWYWAVVGFGFILAELLLPAFVLVWFGLGGLLVMLAVLLVPGMGTAAQVLLWTILSVLMVVLWFKVFKRGQHKVLVGRASAQIVGEVGMLTEAVAPFKNGTVRFQRPVLGSDRWECIADEAIEVGSRVKVLRVDGSLITVGRV